MSPRMKPALLLSFLLPLWSACVAPPGPPGPPPPAGREGKWTGQWRRMRPIRPRGYVCFRALGPILVDGRLDEAAWKAVPWTEDFVDIEGPGKAVPRFRTRAKMTWDDRFLYVAARLEEPHIVGTITRKNAVIFHDPDFEVFLDPDGDNHFYYEFEMNARNTIWELTLERPYRDGGPIRSGDNMPGLLSAVHLEGTINDPSDTDRGWTVEIAFPWKGLKKYARSVPCPPRDGDQWRIDFSRVEWLYDIVDGKYRKIPGKARPEDNWVWSPTGIVDMHRPERWGFLQFSAAPPGGALFEPDPVLAVRDLFMGFYYAAKDDPGLPGRFPPAGLLPQGRIRVPGVEAVFRIEGVPGLAGPVRFRRAGGSWTLSAPVETRKGGAAVLTLRPDSLLELGPPR